MDGRALYVSKIIFSICFMLSLVACVKRVPSAEDPLEPVNRLVYQVNKVVDNLTLKPAAKIYCGVVPSVLRDRVSNMFDTVYLVPTIGNDILQGNFKQAVNDTGRFVINATLGVVGLFDVAKKVGLEPHQSDFGKTLMVWGYQDSTYLVLPFFGPTTIRDSGARVVHYFMTPHTYLHKKDRFGAYATDLIRKREELLDKEKALLLSAVDEYAIVRTSYLQHRDYLLEKQTGKSPDGVLVEDEMLGEPPE